jgi:hypothetical protein
LGINNWNENRKEDRCILDEDMTDIKCFRTNEIFFENIVVQESFLRH